MTDWILYNAELQRGLDLEFIEFIDEGKKSESAILILVSNGGSADAAYKVGRYLQEKYDSFSVLLPGLCKSAGTLLAVAGKELIFTPYGELGPLDVQLTKEDKLGDLESGLNISEAFAMMQDRAKDTYHKLIGEILGASNGIVSIKTALSAASEMVSSLYGPIFAQFDPEEVGSRTRAMRIGEEYASRLNAKWENLQDEDIITLSRSYPAHGFVIDFSEAKLMFRNLRIANDQEIEIVNKLGELARFQQASPVVKFLEMEGETTNENTSTKNAGNRSGRKRKETGSDS